jgi:hypothetical protein
MHLSNTGGKGDKRLKKKKKKKERKKGTTKQISSINHMALPIVA